MKKRVIGRLDIKKNTLIKGVHLEGLRRIGDPCIYARKYYDESIDEILLLDSVATLHGRNALGNVIAEITKDVFIPITVGGGIKDLEQARNLLLSGADKLAINTKALEQPDIINELVCSFGSQAIVASLQIKRINNGWRLMTHFGREVNEKPLEHWVEEVQDRGAGEIMITSIDYDGTNKGFDMEVLEHIRTRLDIPLICSGGISNATQAMNCLKSGADAIAIASAFHYEKISPIEIKSELKLSGLDIR